jgi:DNA invertase Pin-like site-specific DNA recombinase
MLVGYARISTQEQTLALQHEALQWTGCERIFTDTLSGANWTAARHPCGVETRPPQPLAEASD